MTAKNVSTKFATASFLLAVLIWTAHTLFGVSYVRIAVYAASQFTWIPFIYAMIGLQNSRKHPERRLEYGLQANGAVLLWLSAPAFLGGLAHTVSHVKYYSVVEDAFIAGSILYLASLLVRILHVRSDRLSRAARRRERVPSSLRYQAHVDTFAEPAPSARDSIGIQQAVIESPGTRVDVLLRRE